MTKKRNFSQTQQIKVGVVRRQPMVNTRHLKKKEKNLKGNRTKIYVEKNCPTSAQKEIRVD